MRYAIRVAMGIALLAATGIALVQTNQEAIRLPTESSPVSNSGAIREQSLATLYGLKSFSVCTFLQL
jgi:hypothetical protein